MEAIFAIIIIALIIISLWLIRLNSKNTWSPYSGVVKLIKDNWEKRVILTGDYEKTQENDGHILLSRFIDKNLKVNIEYYNGSWVGYEIIRYNDFNHKSYYVISEIDKSAIFIKPDYFS